MSTSGTASVMNPGLLPVLWIEVPPARQASSTRARIAGSMPAGRWNSPRVVTTLAPDASRRHTSSTSQPLRHVQHAVGRQRQHLVDAGGGGHAHLVEPAQVAGVAPGLVGAVHVHAHQLEARVLDHAPQRAAADVARRPLDHPVLRHQDPPSSCGTQLGGRFSMNAAMPSRGSGEWSSAQNIVW